MVAQEEEYSDLDLDEYNAIKEEDSLEKSENVTKFQTAADITNRMLFYPTLNELRDLCMDHCVGAIVELTKQVKSDVKAIDLCRAGDKLLEDYLAGVYNKAKDGKKVKKGTCVVSQPAWTECRRSAGLICGIIWVFWAYQAHPSGSKLSADINDVLADDFVPITCRRTESFDGRLHIE